MQRQTKPITNEEEAVFIPVAQPDIGSLEEELVLDAVRSGWVSSLGGYVDRFEREFAEFCEATHGVAVSNGTAALHLALRAAGIGPGDEVIIPSLTFAATAAAVCHAGATPVFADCEPDIATIAPDAVKKALSPRTRAIIAVHLYGHPAEMDPLAEIAADRGLVLIEDAAEAHGALYRGRVVGGIGDMGTFSFYGNKIITTGEGGMVVTESERWNDRLRFLRDHAMDPTRTYWHPEVGFNYRMTNIQAALGVAQLARYSQLMSHRERVLEAFRGAGLAERHGIEFNPRRDWARPAMWLVSAILPEWAPRGAVEELRPLLREQGIDTRPFFIPLHLMPPYAQCRTVGADGGPHLENTDSLSRRGFNLPSDGRLSEDAVERICDALAEALGAVLRRIAAVR
jgi:perosamine synthetase